MPIFPAALIGFFLAPQWGIGLALGLFWLWTWWKMPAEVVPYLTMLVMLAAALASVPDFIRQRLNRSGRSRLSSPHD